MKRILLAFFLLASQSVFANTATVDGIVWNYTVSNGEATIYKGEVSPAIASSTTGAIEIPSTLGNYPVTTIGQAAFYYCSGLTSVTIPHSVTGIGRSAFLYCRGLTSLTIPDSVTSIGDYAFFTCSGLTSIMIENGVTNIGHYAFYGCSELSSVMIPGSVESIGDRAFEGCTGLTSISVAEGNSSYDSRGNCNAIIDSSDNALILGCNNTAIPDGVTSIGRGAFHWCKELTSIMIPDGVTSIGDEAFSCCYSLRSVSIPDGVTSIGDDAFYSCYYLRSITIPGSVTSIGEDAFSQCDRLTSITIPDSVTSIGNRAFSGCSGMTAFSVADGNPSFRSRSGLLLTKDEKTLVAVPGGLTSVTIPNGVTSIGVSACDWCSKITAVTIPDSVTNIGDHAFYNCSGLTSVTIPNSVTSIGRDAFSGCSGLETLYLPRSYSGTPSVPSGCTIIRYEPTFVLAVNSPVGSPVPSNGTISPNVVISCSVSSPVEEGRWRYVCTGWWGTGSVPASGTSNRVDVLMSEDSSITWLWGETNVWIECEVSGDAALSGPGSGWFRKDGEAAVFPFVPAVRPFSYVLSGDADGVSVDSSAGTIAIPADRPRAVELHVLTRGEAGESGTGKPLPWSDGADAPWFAVADMTAADGFSLRSGEVAQGGTSALETTVTGPGRLSFAWKIAANRSDYARFYVDGEKLTEITRSAGWATVGPIEIDAGEHVLRWTFERGSGAGGAGFLDDVRWTPLHALTVASAAGTPTPAVGTNDVYWGTEVAASVEASAPAGGTRHVCTGWTGTGSVPASGTGTNLTFTVKGDSTLTWNWRTEHWLDVAVASGGSTSFQPQWAAEGSTLSVSLSPNWTLYDIALSGDTNGVTFSGSTLSVPVDGPRSIRATITEQKVSLVVATPMGTVTPAPGTHTHSYGDSLTVSAVSPLAESGGVQVVCTGWTGTGSVPAGGTGTNVTFMVEEDSSITWKWATNVWIDVAVSDGSTSFAPQWVRKGTTAEIELTPSTHLFTIALSGDVADGVELDGTTLRVLADKPRTIGVAIAERKISLAVSSASGTASPAVGTHVHSWGDAVTASVAAPPEADGTRRICTGWTGTGSVPADGSVSSVSFTMQEDSTLTWNWRTEHWLSLETKGPVEADFEADWRAAGTTLDVVFDVLFEGDCGVTLGGDTNGVALDAAARTIAVPCDGPRDIVLTAQPLSLAEALDAPGLVWTSGGGNAWTPQTKTTADGEDAAASGPAGAAGGGDSVLSTTLVGPGTLSWSWRLETAGGSGIDLVIDDATPHYIESDRAGGWVEESVLISGEGHHAVQFVFWNEMGSAENRGFVDCVSWSGAVVGLDATSTTPVPVPHEWLANHGLIAAGASDEAFEAAALATAENGRPVWECYVAGLDPTKEDDFRAFIDMDGGEPVVTWWPSNVAGRVYTVWGKTDLADAWEQPVKPSHRFFQVRVSVGSASGVDERAWPGSVMVSLDATGGEVDPAALVYTEPGTLGALPTPAWGARVFSGWWTRAEGGVEVDSSTAVPWMDWTLHARWKRYSVTFDGNGGQGAMPDQTFAYGIEQELSTNVFTRTDYVFAGWATNATGEIVFTDGQAVSNLTAIAGGSVTLYAAWMPAMPTLYMVIDLSGGASATSYPVSYLPTVPDGGWTDEYKTTKLVLRRIEAGTFTMGSPSDEIGRSDSEKEDKHSVVLTKPFYIGVFEVTQKQWELVMGINPSSYKGEIRPVEYVSYNDIRGSSSGARWPSSYEVDATSFMGKLRARTGLEAFDLPTEAQWEYACRAETTTALNSGMNLTNTSSDASMAAVGRYAYNRTDGKGGYSDHTAVGAYLPNAWGLYDMHGNVREWCLDWRTSTSSLGTSAATDPSGASSGTHREARGGCWEYEAWNCRSASRCGVTPSSRGKNLGLRLSMPLPESTIPKYFVSFNTNGGEGTMPDQTFAYGIEQELSTNVFTRTDYVFAGWATNATGEAVFTDGQSVSNLTAVAGATVALYATWTASYTVSFDANGGSGTMANQSFAYGTAQALSANAFARTGYAFAGWAMSATGPKVYDDRQSVSNLMSAAGGSVTLYAVWTANAYTVEFNANGGSGTMANQSFTYGTAQALTANAFTRTGYTFEGWATSPTGAKVYADKQAVSNLTATAGGSVTLYAKWTASHDKVQLWEGGPYWAKTNIGAENPWDYGYYFWWGDTVGYSRKGGTWTNGYYYAGVTWVSSAGEEMASSPFNLSTCPTYDNGHLETEGWIVTTCGTVNGVSPIGRYVLAPAHDAARAHWGGSWRMPTRGEIHDLCHYKCDWTWTTQNGVNGYIVRGRGDYAANSIFLPAAGYGDGTSLCIGESDGMVGVVGSIVANPGGHYWSSTLGDTGSRVSWSFFFRTGPSETSSPNVGPWGYQTCTYHSRYCGLTIRPVQDFAE